MPDVNGEKTGARINVHVEHIALIECPALKAGESVVLPEGATVSDLLSALGIHADHHRAVVPFVNTRKVKHRQCLCEGDQVFLSLAVGGG